jgi:NADH-quinone oxidoreductase subunit H
MRIDLFDLVATLVKIAVVMGGLLSVPAAMNWVERRVSAWIQDRVGPNRVGPFGLLQPLADAVKFFMKEDIVPGHVHKVVYVLAPAAAVTAAITAFSVIPFGPTLYLFGREIALVVADVNVGVLLTLAATSMGVYGIVMAGWASNNKFSLMGGLRSSAQLISYELAMGLAVISVLAMSDTLRLTQIVAQQGSLWNVFLNPIGALIFMVGSFAETNRAPFDLPEAESELVAGFHTEYSGFRWALYFLAEYANIFVVSSVAVTLFWGGWLRPFPNVAWLEFPVNKLFPFLLFFGSGASCFVLLKKLKDPVQQKTLVGAAILLMLDLWILEGRRRGGPDRAWWLVAVAWLWSNIHLSYWMGFALIAAYMLDEWRGARRDAPDATARVALWKVALAAAAVSFLNPSGWRALWQPFEFVLWQRHEPIFTSIAELQPVVWAANLTNGLPLLMVAWPLLVIRALLRREGSLAQTLLCALFTLMALASQRLLGTYALIACPFVALGVSELFANRRLPQVLPRPARARC